MIAVALPFAFDQPSWLWLLLVIPFLILLTLRSLAGLDPLRRWLAILLRSTVILLLAFALAGFQRAWRTDDLTVIFLLDRSFSVQAMESTQEDFIREAAKTMHDTDRLGVVDFARGAYLEQLPMSGGFFVPPGRLSTIADTDRTDIAAGIRFAMAMFPHDTTKRLVLISDGNDNMGDVLAEARRAKADEIPIDVVPLYYEHKNEVYFDRMIAPSYAEPGEQIPLRMILHTNRAVSGRLVVYHNGELVQIPEEQSRVTLQPGTNTLFMKLVAKTGGTQIYQANFQPDDPTLDAVPMNNSASTFSFVSGPSQALLITANPQDDAVLVDALRSENVGVEMRSIEQVGDLNLLQLMNYSSILLSNIPAAAFTDDQQKEMVTFVKDLGSGLIMLGGPDSFGAGGWNGSPLEEIMPVHFEIKHKRVIPRGALVIVMHSCEIPQGNYWGKEMAKKSVDTISSQDYIGVLAFSYSPGGANWEVPLQLNNNKAAVKAKIDKMANGDMPDFQPMLDMAYRELTSGKGKDAAQKHVIILSDGDPQAPSDKLLRDYAAAKITISTIGIGWGAHVFEPTMRAIAEKTGGTYYPARNPRQLPQIFVKESTIVRKPLIVEEPFTPRMTIPSEVLGGLSPGERLPPLDGIILTSPKQNPNVIIPLVRASEDGNDPLLAYWQYELGKTVAFTSGYWPAWGGGWTQWPKFAKTWAQIVRWTMRQDTPANFDTNTRVEGGIGRITIDALDKDVSYLNNLQLRTNLVGPNNEVIPVTFVQTGPGHYEAEFRADRAGQYLANVQIYDRGMKVGTLRTGLSVPFSPEYRDLGPNEGVLRQIAEITGGRWIDAPPAQAEVFKRDLPPVESRRPSWEWLLAWLFLPAFLLDVSVRRLASWLAFSIAVELVILTVLIFGVELYRTQWGIAGSIILAELIGWTIRFRYIKPTFEFLTHTASALAHVGERSAASLDRLRGTRKRVHEELTSEASSVQEVGPLPGVESRRAARRKFEVTDAELASATGDVAQAMGGAKVDEPGTIPRRTDSGATESETTTSRLLRAKRRAYEKKDKPPDE